MNRDQIKLEKIAKLIEEWRESANRRDRQDRPREAQILRDCADEIQTILEAD